MVSMSLTLGCNEAYALHCVKQELNKHHVHAACEPHKVTTTKTSLSPRV